MKNVSKKKKKKKQDNSGSEIKKLKGWGQLYFVLLFTEDTNNRIKQST